MAAACLCGFQDQGAVHEGALTWDAGTPLQRPAAGAHHTRKLLLS